MFSLEFYFWYVAVFLLCVILNKMQFTCNELISRVMYINSAVEVTSDAICLTLMEIYIYITKYMLVMNAIFMMCTPSNT